jgi:hypothetical protein
MVFLPEPTGATSGWAAPELMRLALDATRQLDRVSAQHPRVDERHPLATRVGRARGRPPRTSVLNPPTIGETTERAGAKSQFTGTERRRSRTFQALGYSALPVLKLVYSAWELADLQAFR